MNQVQQSQSIRVGDKASAANSPVPIAARIDIFEVDPSGSILPALVGSATELSRSGMGFLSRRPIMNDRRAYIRLPLAGGRWRLLFGEVRDVAYSAAGQYQINLQFLPTPSDQSTQQLIAELGRLHGQCDA